MKGITIVAINARYTHASLGARYLLANLGRLREQARLMELTINDPIDTTLESIASQMANIVACGVYIWNRAYVEALLPRIRERLPDCAIVLGGPEISYDTGSALADMADHVICGEADHCFREVCNAILAGTKPPHIIQSSIPELATIALPYGEYHADDLAHRAVYVESSRGCPHHCEYCLSALDDGVRTIPEGALARELDRLICAGVRNLRFVDRSFNLGGGRACRLLEHLLPYCGDGLCIHLELTPDELSPPIRGHLAAFPSGSLHVEVGIQTLDVSVSERIGRPMERARVEEGVRFLIEGTTADVHADLIAGLPGETPESFTRGFDTLYTWGPEEIQVGILKRLHGTPIARHDEAWGMVYSPTPPYEIRQTATMPAAFLADVKRFAAHWERVVNRKHLPQTMAHILAQSPWHTFDQLSRSLAQKHGLYGLDLVEICRDLLDFMTGKLALSRDVARALLRDDYLAGGRHRNLPRFLSDDAAPSSRHGDRAVYPKE